MSYPTRPFVVVSIGGMFGGKLLGDLPTPRLIENGGGEAYDEGGIWRLRDDSYDPPGTTYTRVQIRRRTECPGYGGAMPHLIEYGERLDRGLCDQCQSYRIEDVEYARARREA